MKNYSIVRVGDDYVVRADDKCILKVASRRRAAQLVTEASELLNAQPSPPLAADAECLAEPLAETSSEPLPGDTSEVS